MHWCTADLAWVTAHTYEIYGPLSNGLTQVVYEGTPDAPHRERHFEIIERYGVTVYYTAPTLIRTFMTWFGAELPQGHDLSTLRLLGTVGRRSTRKPGCGSDATSAATNCPSSTRGGNPRPARR